MNDNDILKQLIIDADNLFSGVGMEITAGFLKDNHLILSAISNNSQLITQIFSGEKSNIKNFSFRNWDSVHQLLSSFYNPSYPEDFKLEIEKTEQEYPYKLLAQNGDTSAIYFLQNYEFIQMSPDLNNLYTKRRFAVKMEEIKNKITTLDLKKIKSLAQLGSLLTSDVFKLLTYDNNLYFTIGEESKSIDSGKILIQRNFRENFTGEYIFNISDFIHCYNAIKDCKTMLISPENTNIKLLGITNTNNILVAVIRGRIG